MSKATKEVLPTKPYTQVVSITCDLCGYTAQGDEWEREVFEVKEVEISHRIKIKYRSGESYPEGGSFTYERFDVCPKCWRDTIVPLFKNPPQVDERDY